MYKFLSLCVCKFLIVNICDKAMPPKSGHRLSVVSVYVFSDHIINMIFLPAKVRIIFILSRNPRKKSLKGHQHYPQPQRAPLLQRRLRGLFRATAQC